jgi:hypothetical protein
MQRADMVKKMKATLSQMERALPALVQEIQRIAGIKMQLKVKMRDYGNGQVQFRIYSDDLSGKLSGLTAPIFKEINFNTWLGDDDASRGFINFAPKIEYMHYDGGCNGTAYIWSCLLFNKETEAWDFENSQLIYNK